MTRLEKAIGVVRSKSPGSQVHASSEVHIGKTATGKKISSQPSSKLHQGFSPAEHMDAYRAHAQHLSKLGGETAASVIEHHKNAMNHHFAQGVGAKIKKAREHVGHTRNGHKVHTHSHKHEKHHKHFSAEDHSDAAHHHHKRAVSIASLMGTLAEKGKNHQAFGKMLADHADAAHFHQGKSRKGHGK